MKRGEQWHCQEAVETPKPSERGMDYVGEREATDSGEAMMVRGKNSILRNMRR